MKDAVTGCVRLSHFFSRGVQDDACWIWHRARENECKTVFGWVMIVDGASEVAAFLAIESMTLSFTYQPVLTCIACTFAILYSVVQFAFLPSSKFSNQTEI